VLDETKNPPSLILQHLDDNLLHASSVKTLTSSDVKFVTKRVLQAIQVVHQGGFTHTGMLTKTFYAISYSTSILLLNPKLLDIKPENILVNYSAGSTRFADVQLADFGDVTRIDPKDYLRVGMDGPHMGAAIFRSPEAMMQLRWGQSTDIWSFGTTVG
jgi:casein kinase II subunit alpha